ncbi:hypothetical protein ACA910_013036 [Epithemia clementina (nom. ined.)]
MMWYSLPWILHLIILAAELTDAFPIFVRPPLVGQPDNHCRKENTNHHHFLAPQQLGTFETLQDNIRRPVTRQFYGIYNNELPMPFQSVWKIQQDLQQRHFDRLLTTARTPTPPKALVSQQTQALRYGAGRASLSDINNQDIVLGDSSLDTILFVQHEPVFTFGTASNDKFLLNANTDIPIVDISRGGEITYHGPGQLVVYPILDLRHYQQDLHWYIRALEETAIGAISAKLRDDDDDDYDATRANGAHRNDSNDSNSDDATTRLDHLTPTRLDDITGVWLDHHKVAAIGIHARRWITQHGLAINVEEQCLEPFQEIVPCGLIGRKVGYLNQFLKKPTTVAEFVPYVIKAMEDIFLMDFGRTTEAH